MPTSSDSAPGGQERPPAVLRLTDVAAGYGGAAIVSGVSISVGPGEVVSIIGPNGAGKSTLLKAVTGRLPVMTGTVTFNDRDITNWLRRLESEGLVVTDVHRGATVARTELEGLEENYRILAALEALAGSLAVAKMSDGDLGEIEALYREVAACQPDDGRLAELNRQFHFRVYECARSPMLLLLMRLLWRSFPDGPQAGRPHQESVRQHAKLLRALKERDEEQVAAIIRDHVLGSIKYPPQR
jgi:energy-coupling factor transporter ATP-binding protein EcfA2